MNLFTKRMLQKILLFCPDFMLNQLLKAKKTTIVLMYHSISKSTNFFAIDESCFVEQIKFLQENFEFIDVSDIVATDSLYRSEHLRIAVTFDDGYKDISITVKPFLSGRSIPFCVFITPSIIEKSHESYMNWEDIRKLSKDSKITIGSHSMTHIPLDAISESNSDLKYELAGSKSAIVETTGIDVRYFAYPYGYLNLIVSESVSHYYDAAFTSSDITQSTRYSIPRMSVDKECMNLKRFKIRLLLHKGIKKCY